MRRAILLFVSLQVSGLAACDESERDRTQRDPSAIDPDTDAGSQPEDGDEPEDSSEPGGDEPERSAAESQAPDAAAQDAERVDAASEMALQDAAEVPLDAAPDAPVTSLDAAPGEGGAGLDAASADAHAVLDAEHVDTASSPDAAESEAAVNPDAAALPTEAGEDAALPPEPPRECAEHEQAACPNPDYPCIASDDGAGYQCRGQYAAWPIAEKKVGAKAAPKYTVRTADNVVLDEVTGLLWQRSPPAIFPGCSGALTKNVAGSGCSWEEARQYCAGLTLAGRSWRLPTKIELESLLDYVTQPSRQLHDPVAFPDADTRFYWSASESAVTGPEEAYVVSFQVGLSFRNDKLGPARVRCVHSQRVVNAPPGERYVLDEQADRVFDRFTQLEWQRQPSEHEVDLDSAETYCADAGFRVPSIKELKSLFDPNEDTFAIDVEVFPVHPLGWWLLSKTSMSVGTLVITPFGGAELTDVYLGEDPVFTEPGPLQASLHVRCVR